MNHDEKQCPFCGEIIKKVAIKCKHCKSDLGAIATTAESNESIEAHLFAIKNGNYSYTEKLKKIREIKGVSLSEAQEILGKESDVQKEKSAEENSSFDVTTVIVYIILFSIAIWIVTVVWGFLNDAKKIVKNEVVPIIERELQKNHEVPRPVQRKDQYIEEMISSYNNNQARFQQRYRGTGISGAGIVTSVQADPLGTGLVFYVSLDVNGSKVQCITFNKSDAANLDRGARINFNGNVWDVTFDTLQIHECVFRR